MKHQKNEPTEPEGQAGRHNFNNKSISYQVKVQNVNKEIYITLYV